MPLPVDSRRRLPAAALAAALLGIGLPGARAGDTDDRPFDAGRARRHYLMFCQGCHEADASGRNTVPPMRGQLGYFLGVDGGREFIARVPGVISNPMSDADVAEVLNWVLDTFSARELPEDFTPYTAAEIRALRQTPLTDVKRERRRLIERLERQQPALSIQ